jgi:hypothetical protein
MTTKIYKNTGDETIMVTGLGEILAGQQISVTSEYQPQVVLANYPTLEVIEE